MTDTRISQPIEITRNHFPTLGMFTDGVRVNIAVADPGNLSSGGPGGKIEVGRARSPFPLPIFLQPFGLSGIFVHLKPRWNGDCDA